MDHDPLNGGPFGRTVDRIVKNLTDKELAVLEKRFENEPMTLADLRARRRRLRPDTVPDMPDTVATDSGEG